MALTLVDHFRVGEGVGCGVPCQSLLGAALVNFVVDPLGDVLEVEGLLKGVVGADSLNISALTG